MTSNMKELLRRRDFLRGSAAAGMGVLAAGGPAIIRAGGSFPTATHGSMTGDVSNGKAVVWSRADRPSRMIVNWKTSDEGDVRRVAGPHLLDVSDYTGRVVLKGLPPGQQIQYEVVFEDLSAKNSLSSPVKGSFRTPTASIERDILFLWSGDTVGQGWGINLEQGGMRIYETMRRAEPDFFLHSGDNIYADGPISPEVKLPDGTIWKNVVTEEKSKVAETLNEFRGNYKYNLMDANVLRFQSQVPQVWQWDDHEVLNNWSPSKDLSADSRYKEKNVPLLVARATRAFQEYSPMQHSADETERVYRKIEYGPMLDVFVLDMRTYRGPNTYNRQTSESDDTTYLGREQMGWLQQGLKTSKATWKVIASDMPIGLVVGDGNDKEGRPQFENSSNGDGPELGREFEIARLLSFLKANNVQNIVWLTADVHYTSAHHYSPDRAQFKDFLPFWEFVSGPLNAGTFGPNGVDDTFGIQVVYQKTPAPGQANLPPSAGMQFYGEVRIAAHSQVMIVTLRDLNGAALFTKMLQPSLLNLP